jgi:hypothetical protein
MVADHVAAVVVVVMAVAVAVVVAAAAAALLPQTLAELLTLAAACAYVTQHAGVYARECWKHCSCFDCCRFHGPRCHLRWRCGGLAAAASRAPVVAQMQLHGPGAYVASAPIAAHSHALFAVLLHGRLPERRAQPLRARSAVSAVHQDAAAVQSQRRHGAGARVPVAFYAQD